MNNSGKPWNSLILMEVFAYLEPPDLCRIAQVCKAWNEVVESTLVWKKLCYPWGWTPQRLEEHEHTSKLLDVPCSRTEKQVFRSWVTVKRCLEKGCVSVRDLEKRNVSERQLRTNRNNIRTAVQDGHFFYTGGQDGTIKQWTTWDLS